MELVGHANRDHIAPTRAVLKKATVPFPSQPGLTLESFQGVRWCLEVGMRLILALGITAGLTSASGSMVRAQDHQDAPTAARGRDGHGVRPGTHRTSFSSVPGRGRDRDQREGIQPTRPTVTQSAHICLTSR